jgi:hypothetical protein
MDLTLGRFYGIVVNSGGSLPGLGGRFGAREILLFEN